MWLVASVWVSAGLGGLQATIILELDSALQMAQSSLVRGGPRMWALKNLLGPAQLCTLCMNLSQACNGAKPQLPHL